MKMDHKIKSTSPIHQQTLIQLVIRKYCITLNLNNSISLFIPLLNWININWILSLFSWEGVQKYQHDQRSVFVKNSINYSGGSRISPRRGHQLFRGAPTYDFAKCSQKLHEIERIWTPGGGVARPKFYYVDPPLNY